MSNASIQKANAVSSSQKTALQEWKRDFKRNYNLYLMALPALLLFIVFCYFPMYGIIIAFKNYDMAKGISGGDWVGFKYFIQFFKDPACWRLIRNTLSIGIYSLLWGFWPPILLAILLNETKLMGYKKTVQSISYLPHFISIVVIVGMLMEVLSPTGIVNQFRTWAFDAKSIPYFNEAKYFRGLYIGSGIWQGMGWGSIIYLAALSGISSELYEAAMIDGANRFRRIWHISLPGILPVVTIILILNAASIVNVGFEKIQLMYQPLTYETADVISTYVYRRGITSLNFSYGTAIGLLNSVVAFAILYISNTVSKNMKGSTLW